MFLISSSCSQISNSGWSFGHGFKQSVAFKCGRCGVRESDGFVDADINSNFIMYSGKKQHFLRPHEC